MAVTRPSKRQYPGIRHTYQTTPCRIPDDSHLHQHRCENLISRIHTNITLKKLLLSDIRYFKQTGSIKDFHVLRCHFQKHRTHSTVKGDCLSHWAVRPTRKMSKTDEETQTHTVNQVKTCGPIATDNQLSLE